MNGVEILFDEVWDHISGWKGWLREDQARLLWKGATKVKNGAQVVEIGSFHGKSASVLLAGTHDSVRINAIDPHAGTDRGPGEWVVAAELGEGDHGIFWRNIRTFTMAIAGSEVPERFNYIRKFSSDAIEDVEGNLDLLYIDGAHSYVDVSKDIKLWSTKVDSSGELFIHDVFNSVGVTLAVLQRMVLSNRWRLIARAHSLCEFEKVDIGAAEVIRKVLWFLVHSPLLLRAVLVRRMQNSRFGNWSRIAQLKRGY